MFKACYMHFNSNFMRQKFAFATIRLSMYEIGKFMFIQVYSTLYSLQQIVVTYKSLTSELHITLLHTCSTNQQGTYYTFCRTVCSSTNHTLI